MTKYICPICKEVIYEEELYCKIHSATWYEPACYERRTCCYGTDYEEAWQCEECGEWFTREELDDDFLCEYCREEIKEE